MQTITFNYGDHKVTIKSIPDADGAIMHGFASKREWLPAIKEWTQNPVGPCTVKFNDLDHALVYGAALYLAGRR